MAFPEILAAADRAALQHLGGPFFYKPFGAAAVELRGIFDAAYVRVDVGQAGVSSAGPAIFCRLADLPADPESDEPEVTVEGVTYRLREIQKDGLGGVLLLLHRE